MQQHHQRHTKWASDDKPILQHISSPSPPAPPMTHKFQHRFSESKYALLRETERRTIHIPLLPVCLIKVWVSEG